jgi:hypothetical protein
MSIDNRIFVPAGARNRKLADTGPSFTKYKVGDRMPASQMTPHQVFLAHQRMIDEQYFFEDADDARWFWVEGYKGRLFLDSDGKTVMSYDRMALWIAGEQVDDRGYGRFGVNVPPAKLYAVLTHAELYASREAAEIAAAKYNHEFHDQEPATVVKVKVQGSVQYEAQTKPAGDPVSDKHKPPEPAKDPYSLETLQRAYQMREEGSTRFAIMSETGVDPETADWIFDRQSAGLGLPADKPVTIVDSELDDEL